MAIQRQGWITLESCIYDYINEAELPPHKYLKLYHLGYRCMEDLGLDFFYQIKSVKIPLNANKTLTLPSDYRKWTKVGVLNGIGELVPLKYNENITTFGDLSPDRIAQTQASNFANYYSFSSPVFFNYWNGTSYNNLYGIGWGSGLYAGGFKVDEGNGVILLDAPFNWTGCILEYTANPNPDEEYFLPAEFREAVIAWLAWMDIRNMPASRKGNLGTVRDRRHEYFEARRRGLDKYRPFHIDQAYMQHLDNSRLVVKA